MPSHMRCQNCQDEEATVHISGTKTTVPRPGAESSEEEFTLHFCPSCAEEYGAFTVGSFQEGASSWRGLDAGLHAQGAPDAVRHSWDAVREFADFSHLGACHRQWAAVGWHGSGWFRAYRCSRLVHLRTIGQVFALAILDANESGKVEGRHAPRAGLLQLSRPRAHSCAPVDVAMWVEAYQLPFEVSQCLWDQSVIARAQDSHG